MKRKTLRLLTLIAGRHDQPRRLLLDRGAAAAGADDRGVTRGNIVKVVSATGTLQAVTTVQVGSQVSGSVEALFADFNAIVRKGQVLATLDQSTYATAVEQAQASLVSAEAEAERLRVAQVGGRRRARPRARSLREAVAAGRGSRVGGNRRAIGRIAGRRRATPGSCRRGPRSGRRR